MNIERSIILAELKRSKVVAIVRRQYGVPLVNLAKALLGGGIKFIECTFDQSDPECITKTAEAIKTLIEETKGEMYVGAGTVLTEEQVEAAYKAGGQFIISPNVNKSVIKRTRELNMVSIPGAMTPTEILAAHDAGADIVKLFPANTLGIKYAKDIMAPISHVRLLATGGITEQNFEDYLKIGFAGAGVSSSLTSKELVNAENWEEIRRRAEAFSKISSEYKK